MQLVLRNHDGQALEALPACTRPHWVNALKGGRDSINHESMMKARRAHHCFPQLLSLVPARHPAFTPQRPPVLSAHYAVKGVPHILPLEGRSYLLRFPSFPPVVQSLDPLVKLRSDFIVSSLTAGRN